MGRTAKYKLNEGVIRQEYKKTKRFLVSLLASIGLVGTMTVPVFAAYGTQPGFTVSNDNTICAGHGSFGAFGQHGDVAHDFGVNNLGSNNKPGADGQATGANNSSLCGNPQRN